MDLPTPLRTSSRSAEPGSESATSVMPDPLLGTVFQPSFIKSVLKLNYSVELIVTSFVSATLQYLNHTQT